MFPTMVRCGIQALGSHGDNPWRASSYHYHMHSTPPYPAISSYSWSPSPHLHPSVHGQDNHAAGACIFFSTICSTVHGTLMLENKHSTDTPHRTVPAPLELLLELQPIHPHIHRPIHLPATRTPHTLLRQQPPTAPIHRHAGNTLGDDTYDGVISTVWWFACFTHTYVPSTEDWTAIPTYQPCTYVTWTYTHVYLRTYRFPRTKDSPDVLRLDGWMVGW